ncbi:hypothetical protein RGU70_08105 [Herbaspirillum sp. RTI4]|uniref:hypothetical protein n=1 Tax=Herbaspirillum sp. RTI4 TaxID=3048640 RepID=UPI002AB33481|nr:hypothetical protein [Herbaspirillum sp. RTI4]MDY7578282.1 hypothetical protein [Herbaspirillum sp. RTI4]MEA9981225.1 hypothetical protein [Herbaspirillum sp. RTI4]
MAITELPYRATTAQACDWLAQQTGTSWTLASLIGEGLTPFVWLDYDADYPELFGDANGGYAAPIFFEGDIARIVAGSADVLITTTKDAYKIVTQLKSPGFRRELDALRFMKKDLERLAGKLKHASEAALKSALNPEPVITEGATESQMGINKKQVLLAFSALLKMDMEQALVSGDGLFGDEGSRIKATTKKAKNKIEWNPVTLALGLNEVYRVPMSHLKRAFATHDFLLEWQADWNESLLLLGK